MFLQNFRQFSENWIFEGISTGASLIKMVKICIISICAKKIFFDKIICSTHQRKFLSTIFQRFLENWFFEGISTGADLKKMVKICIISICAKKIFFGKIICSTHQRKCFSTILGIFLKIEFLKEYRQARTLKKWWKFVLSQFVLRKYFWQNYLFHSSKKVFLHNFRQFLENWIFEGISTGTNLTKMVNICTILNCAKKLFFGKIICSTHQRKSFSTILGNFWKIEFLKEYRQARALTKMVKICIILTCAKKIFFGKIIYSTHQRKCFSTMLGNFWKIEFLKEYRQARTLKKWWKFVLSQFVLRKYFLAKLFVPLIKESVSPQFQAFFGKLNFWRNIDRRGP